MISFLISAIKVIFLLGFLIGIHETGHFLVAKLCKVRVNEFAIGFGPKIWQKQGKETKYVLRIIPLGGFVSMEGEEERSDKEGSFSNASIPKRIAIVSAGALVNIIFAIIVYFILSASTTISYSSNVVAGLEPGYSAESAGIEVGDTILEINNKNITTSQDVSNVLEEAKNTEITVLIERDGQKQEIKLTPTEQKYKSTGIYLHALEQKSTEIVSIEPGSSAEKQGLQTGDIITKINGEDVTGNPERLIEILQTSTEDSINLGIERDSNQIEIELIPDEESAYYLGVQFQMPEDTLLNRIYYSLYDTKEFLGSIVESVKQLFSGNTSTAELIGPVGISEIVVQTNGLREFIYILVVVSLSLGVTNLLPFPPLDGGKILFLIIEAIRRKPLKEETEIKIQLLGFSILIGLSIFITYNDILRLF